jgi:hypothetical protein
MCQSGSMLDARPYFGRQRTKGGRIDPVKVQIKDSLGIREIVLLQIVVETRTWRSKVGNACRYTARDRESDRASERARSAQLESIISTFRHNTQTHTYIPDTCTRQDENVLDGTIHDPRGNLSQRLGHFLWLVYYFTNVDLSNGLG